MKIHEFYIKRAIQLAKNGLGNTYPNPIVGCVIVADDRIIGEGFTSPAGQNHAEVNAVQSVKDQTLLKKATLYVTLEPCSHYGKTPPCADLIIKHRIPNVVIGTLDTHEKVCGRGVKKLMEAGCKVTVGVLEEACKEVNRRFFTFQEQKRPYVILKWAQSENGYVSPLQDTQNRAPIWITNEISRQLVHKWRTEENAILVGTNTILKDNPRLNSRDWKGNSPIRIVIDRSLKIPKASFVLDESIPTICITDKKNKKKPQGNLLFEAIDFNLPIAGQIAGILYNNNLQSVIVEGGSKTLQTFIDEGIWDEARVFEGKTIIEEGTKAPLLNKYNTVEKHQFMEDVLKIYQK
ncbi:bifunctional diaminohydroxyphosphoribosylaminopyrimidine deaminase/5-amino-6-(5-phosphoribosylamino)uracil reductase RibD [Galbibacter pacificus]|uniref:Riboflavin biosynthesis protein RibD n=1 Tax=Galbibacter pacificus TaxID=2996052 RepID=A0ABT6FPG9_9FLAO|nr:bifunctional diaminohydroxyphosphoribosylaminopyrimidine deaminase/5-amino-6-(5-phosphoribosylamino)uracil reductase RibD [Galbibacter pacificus]MDG3582366.1 bifunctional diaminohydroxyphosphoribosylaminopyrimidine deaminase/5-amino-6-(5-phosphoribosylamino)uracil reductase RibD [Galbibacter pacificus]MDG3585158.1 bifunctional diaminohydroxyphosphoribosylaminopyrimidine deaminase/5-amino-6-(5-phosphoribosylamino)uracil reductase RibD [Galbibacter pacificus]